MSADRELARELLAELKSMTLLFRSALLCTTVEIAREARPHLNRADALIIRADRAMDKAETERRSTP